MSVTALMRYKRSKFGFNRSRIKGTSPITRFLLNSVDRGQNAVFYFRFPTLKHPVYSFVFLGSIFQLFTMGNIHNVGKESQCKAKLL
jgi:hypothetical protein